MIFVLNKQANKQKASLVHFMPLHQRKKISVILDSICLQRNLAGFELPLIFLSA
jgi:hypothetical protein